VLQKLKVALLRWLYLFMNWFAWRRQAKTGEFSDLTLAASGSGLQLRLFANLDGAEKPLLVYFHGGGWVIGDLNTHTPVCQQLSRRSACSLVSVNYSLAPEHPFPAAQDDALTALAWIAAHPTKLGPNNGKLILAGDSAGANLAACLCLELPATTRERLLGAALIYPVVDHYSAGHASYQQRATGHPLTRSLMHWFWDTYLAGYDADHPMVQRAMPLRMQDLSAMPSIFLVTAEFDPLRDEGIAFGEKLKAAGIALEYHHFADAAHGFASSEGPTRDFEDFMARLCKWLTACV
jgi:acetyl esterase